MLSLVHDINKQWSVMGDLGWQDWSQFGAPQITVVGREVDKSSRLKDLWHTALGVQFRPTEQWRLNAGVAFDSTVYNSQSDVALTLPTGDEWRFATGAQYQITPQSNIGVPCRICICSRPTYSHHQFIRGVTIIRICGLPV